MPEVYNEGGRKDRGGDGEERNTPTKKATNSANMKEEEEEEEEEEAPTSGLGANKLYIQVSNVKLKTWKLMNILGQT